MQVTVIREIRETLGLSQTELARHACISQGYLSQIEQGEVKSPSIQAVIGIACSLDVPLHQLLTRMGVDCGCGQAWGMDLEVRLLHLFGRLSSQRRALIIEVARGLRAPQSELLCRASRTWATGHTIRPTWS